MNRPEQVILVLTLDTATNGLSVTANCPVPKMVALGMLELAKDSVLHPVAKEPGLMIPEPGLAAAINGSRNFG